MVGFYFEKQGGESQTEQAKFQFGYEKIPLVGQLLIKGIFFVKQQKCEDIHMVGYFSTKKTATVKTNHRSHPAISNITPARSF